MTVTVNPAPATIAVFNPCSIQHVEGLTRLYTGYLLEELDRTGQQAPGLPVAVWLRTLVLQHSDRIIGFCSVDLGRHSVELLYLAPEYRRRGIARNLLQQLAEQCPGRMTAKGPFTPASRALIDRLGIPPQDPPEEEARQAAETLNRLHRDIARLCPHSRKRSSRPCQRCYRRLLRRTAQAVVCAYVLAVGINIRQP